MREAPAHLDEGGFCQLLANWVHPAGASWKERLADWFEGTECDAWVIQRSAEDVEEYAVGWVLHGEPAQATRALRRGSSTTGWRTTSDSGSSGSASASSRCASAAYGRPFLRFEDLRHDPGGACGDDIARSFELRDWLDSLDSDDRLLDTRFAVAPDVHLHRDLVASAGGFELRTSELRRATGLGRQGLVDEYGARVVGGCNGITALRSLLVDLASEIGADTDAVAAVALPVVRNLVEQGFLVPAASP